MPGQYWFMDPKELTSQMKKDEADVAEESFQYRWHLMLSTCSGRFVSLVVHSVLLILLCIPQELKTFPVCDIEMLW